jgi:hypothetical protein
MDVPIVPSKTVRGRVGLFTARPTIYILILLTAFLAPFVHRLRNNMIFACGATGYTYDRYLSYCGATNYGDYEHGAFWFDLEPTAELFAANADVLFLGNSSTQFAFSTAATGQWFSSASASYYLLGFILWENSIFEQALLQKLKPRAKVYIINIDKFFQPSEAPVASILMHDPDERARYLNKRYLQFVHKAICMRLTSICGHITAIFRSRQTGMYFQELSEFKDSERPVSYEQKPDKREIDDGVAIGRNFLSELPAKPECVMLTVVPYVGTKFAVADAIARGLGKMLVVPERLDGLNTFDGIHLDPPSAARWSKAFLEAAGPQIEKCLETHTSS